LEDENDFFLDLFYIYFVCWAKLFTFICFILELYNVFITVTQYTP
jgi:hypothetical protein